MGRLKRVLSAKVSRHRRAPTTGEEGPRWERPRVERRGRSARAGRDQTSYVLRSDAVTTLDKPRHVWPIGSHGMRED